MTHKELAEEESELWDRTPKEVRGRMIGVFWNLRDGRGDNPVENRRAIFNAHSEALWDAVDKYSMPLRGASRIAIVARKLKEPVEQVLERVQALAAEKNKTIQAAALIYEKSVQRPADLEANYKKLKEVAEYIAKRTFSGGDTKPTKKHITRFLVDVEEAVAKLRRALRDGSQYVPEREDVENACDVLGVDPPDKGAILDAKLFRKQARGLRTEYHADRMGAAYDSERYLAIGRALDILEKYNATLEGRP
jgi:hypothetical protein